MGALVGVGRVRLIRCLSALPKQDKEIDVGTGRSGVRGAAKPGCRSSWMGSRLPLALVGTGLLIVIVALLLMRLIGLGPWARTLSGVIISPPLPAPDFTLHDQFDQPIRLSSYRGKVVVLTFLYTNCPDACPLITEKLHQAYGMLGPDASRTAILAVTVDPDRDTIQQVRAFSIQKDMLNKWHFLIGSPSEVQPVWAAYGAAATRADRAADQAKTTPLPSGASGSSATTSAYLVEHSAPIFLIDPAGQERVILDIGFAPSELVQDIRALLG